MSNVHSIENRLPGPKTPEAKEKTRLNAYRHGLTGKTLIIAEEDSKRYALFSTNFLAKLAPVGEDELFLANAAVNQAWRLQSIPTLCNNIIILGHFDGTQSRFQADHPEIQDAVIEAATTADRAATLERMSLYEQRIQRSFEKYIAQLKQLQAEREAQRLAELEEARILYEFSKTRDLPWKPADDGFVFSLEQIEVYTYRHHRKNPTDKDRNTYLNDNFPRVARDNPKKAA